MQFVIPPQTLPQRLDRGATPTFNGLILSGAANPRIITAPGDVTVGPNDVVIVLNKSAAEATVILLPAVATRAGLALEIYDWKGNALSISVEADGTEKIMGAAAPWPVVSNGTGMGGKVVLRPVVALGGWLAR